MVGLELFSCYYRVEGEPDDEATSRCGSGEVQR